MLEDNQAIATISASHSLHLSNQFRISLTRSKTYTKITSYFRRISRKLCNSRKFFCSLTWQIQAENPTVVKWCKSFDVFSCLWIIVKQPSDVILMYTTLENFFQSHLQYSMSWNRRPSGRSRHIYTNKHDFAWRSQKKNFCFPHDKRKKILTNICCYFATIFIYLNII